MPSHLSTWHILASKSPCLSRGCGVPDLFSGPTGVNKLLRTPPSTPGYEPHNLGKPSLLRSSVAGQGHMARSSSLGSGGKSAARDDQRDTVGRAHGFAVPRRTLERYRFGGAECLVPF